MENTFFIVRHAQTQKDPSKPVTDWVLSSNGVFAAQALAKNKDFRKIDVIISSESQKCYSTALPIAQKLSKNIDRYSELNEIRRKKDQFLSKEAYEFAVKYALKNPDKSKFEWENASRALERFSDKIVDIDSAYQNRNIMVVSHNLVINLYIANILGKMHQVYERAIKTKNCDYAIVRDRKVIKDIIIS